MRIEFNNGGIENMGMEKMKCVFCYIADCCVKM